MNKDCLPTIALLFNQSGAAVALFDEDDRLTYANESYCRLTQIDPASRLVWSDLIRRNHRDGNGLLIETDNIEEWLAYAHKRRGSETYREFEVDAADGRWFLMTETVIPGVGLLNIGIDITRSKDTATTLQQEYQRALMEAETDMLTSMGNRRALHRLRKLLTTTGKGRSASALMLDIDLFKPYNDSLGHIKGDECLEAVADVIRSSLRSTDAYPLRIGGEEFLVLLVDTPIDTAHTVATRIREKMKNRAIPHPTSPSGHVTLSTGIAETVIEDDSSITRLLSDADRALYQSKHSGRDRISLAE